MAINERQPRQAVEQEARRCRDSGTLDRMTSMRLAVPESVRARYPDREFRWINDFQNRIHAKTVLDDWDKVSDVDPIPVDFRDGQPVKAYLCMKPMQFVQEDRAAAERDRKDQENSMLRSAGNDPSLEGASYVPDGNLIKRGPLGP